MVQLTAEQQARRRMKKALELGKTFTPRGRNKMLLAEFAENINEHTTAATSANFSALAAAIPHFAAAAALAPASDAASATAAVGPAIVP